MSPAGGEETGRITHPPVESFIDPFVPKGSDARC